MSFLYPYVLIALLLPVVLGVAAYLLHVHRTGNWQKLVSAAHRQELVRTTSPLHSVIPFILALLALACCIIAAARPYNGYKNTEALVTGRNLIIALDISRSMETQDVTPSRLEEARTAARVLIDSLPTDKIGLIIFSGEAELTIPLTYDHLTLQETLNLINRDWESYGGSNLEHVLKLAMQNFERSAPTGTNALVILSDGEDTMDFSPALLDEVRKKNLLLITVGIGTSEGATIPDPQSESGMWQDADGKHVISKLQPETLSMLARETGGDFFIMNNSTDLAAFAKTAVEKLDRHEEAQSAGKAPNDMYAYFSVAALVLAIAAILLATRWRHMPTRLHGSMGIVLLALITAPTLHAAPQEESLAAYRQALAHQSAGKTEECADELSKALLDEDPHMQAAVLHRLGNLKTEETFTKLRELYAETSPGQPAQPSGEQLEDIVKKLEESSTYYQDALSAQPDCAPAQTNLQRVRQLIEDIKKEIERLKQQQQQDNQQKQDEQQQQQDDQQKQDQQQQQNDQQKQDEQQQQDDQQKQDQQQDDQQKQDEQQQQDDQQKQDEQQQQDDQQKQDQQQQDNQQKQDKGQKQESQQKQEKQQENNEQQNQKPQPTDAQRKAQRQRQRAQDILNMNRDEEDEAESRSIRRQFEYRTQRKRPKKDY